MTADRPDWDRRLAEDLDGAVVLIGITYRDAEGARVEQCFGTVIAIDETAGITLRLDGTRLGEIFRLPPDLRAFRPAKPGAYRLRQTGEVVTDPDYTATWESTRPTT